jgi:RNA polymerase sigma factor (sigma-70 family)
MRFWFQAPSTDHHPWPAATWDDAALAIAAREDQQAFSILYDRYLTPMYRYCYARLGSREAAEDATSEVFLKALSGIDGYRNGVFVAWLFRIAQRVIIDAYRRGGRSAPLSALELASSPDCLPEDHALINDERSALHTALARLPADQRSVLELQLAGWSGQDIAAALGKTHAAIKMLRYRAVERLRGILTDTDVFGEVDQ